MSRTSHHAWRSALFMPASNARVLEKSRDLSADILIFDLEDAVAADVKEEARDMATARVRDRSGDAAHVIRINDLGSEYWRDDLAAAANASADAVLLPKINSISDVRKAHDAAPGMPLWAMIETSLALLNLKEIALEGRELGVQALFVGANDLGADLQIPADPAREGLVPHLAVILAAARAGGLVALDGVYNDTKDDDGFDAQARQGRMLGFDGKSLIHPSQIEAANAAFSPSDREHHWAETVIAAFADPANAGCAVLSVNGEMVEELHLKRARRILAAAQV